MESECADHDSVANVLDEMKAYRNGLAHGLEAGVCWEGARRNEMKISFPVFRINQLSCRRRMCTRLSSTGALLAPYPLKLKTSDKET
jgi:hypothetical protein